jgi:hypothetical protein
MQLPSESALYVTLQAVLARKGYAFFDTGAYNLNIIGIRAASREPRGFDDRLVIAHRDGSGRPLAPVYEITTDPGLTSLTGARHSKGTAILLPGQYRGLYEIGIHGRSKPTGGYRALEQRVPARYARDNNGDGVLDIGGPVFEGNLKTNIHHQGVNATDDWVGVASAGCQVFRRAADFNVLMRLADLQVGAGHGKRFTYTLIEESDL